jgi:hypothetical protein
MKVSKNSWHYKLNDSLFQGYIESAGNNLCRYFWMTIGSMCKVCIGLLIITLIITLVTVGVRALYLGVAALCLNAVSLQIAVWLFLLLLIALPSVAINCLRRFIISTKIPAPNILIEFIKAKKDEYCPMIDFE